jgi:hypothetical protein
VPASRDLRLLAGVALGAAVAAARSAIVVAAISLRNSVTCRPLAGHMRFCLFAVMVVALGAAAATPTAVAAGLPGPPRQNLEVLRTTLHPDERTIVMTVRCRAPKARCSGILRVDIGDVDPLTAPVRVRLVPGHTRHLNLRLRANGLHRVAEQGPEQVGTVTLSTRGRHLSGFFALSASPTCRTGATLTTSPEVRVFRLLGFGVYGCLRPAGRPVLIAAEDASIFSSGVELVAAAGGYVAVAIRFSDKCSSSTIVLYNVRARRVAGMVSTANTVDGPANGCTGTSPVVALLVRPSGAMAWSEAAGDDGNVTIRSVDPSGRTQTFDSAADIDAESLQAIDASSVRWTHGGSLRTATLQ